MRLAPRSILLLGWFAALPGCAGWEQRLIAPQVTPAREARKSDAVQTFESSRDTAQVNAALDRWRSGDPAGCEAMLTTVVSRRPDHLDARLQLGHVLWSRGDAAAAEPHFRAVLEKQPERAEAHHGLGLVLDGTDRSEEARSHFARALELEPDNEIYQLTCDSTQSAYSHQRSVANVSDE